MKKAFFYETMMGKTGLAEEDGKLTNVFFTGTVFPETFEMQETPLLKNTARQLAEYFAGKRQKFEIPLNPQGTDFEVAVWQALLSIPWGVTRSYKNIAEQIGRPKAFRAVGRANALNPISIIIPCHRVIGANGQLVGYSAGLELKEKLLQLEGKN